MIAPLRRTVPRSITPAAEIAPARSPISRLALSPRTRSVSARSSEGNSRGRSRANPASVELMYCTWLIGIGREEPGVVDKTIRVLQFDERAVLPLAVAGDVLDPSRGPGGTAAFDLRQRRTGGRRCDHDVAGEPRGGTTEPADEPDAPATGCSLVLRATAGRPLRSPRLSGSSLCTPTGTAAEATGGWPYRALTDGTLASWSLLQRRTAGCRRWRAPMSRFLAARTGRAPLRAQRDRRRR